MTSSSDTSHHTANRWRSLGFLWREEQKFNEYFVTTLWYKSSNLKHNYSLQRLNEYWIKICIHSLHYSALASIFQISNKTIAKVGQTLTLDVWKSVREARSNSVGMQWERGYESSLWPRCHLPVYPLPELRADPCNYKIEACFILIN